MATYSKPWLAIPDQIQQLKDEGLIVEDDSRAESFLRSLNYYRFSGYGLVFEKSRHQFHEGATFEQIRQTYEFDRALRDLVYESMEVIELDVRTSVAYTFGEKHGAFGYTDSANFHKSFRHKEWLGLLHKEIRRSTERFALHFKQKYDEYPNLPLWAATETMSFGCLSRMIQGMEKADLKSVSSRYICALYQNTPNCGRGTNPGRLHLANAQRRHYQKFWTLPFRPEAPSCYLSTRFSSSK